MQAFASPQREAEEIRQEPQVRSEEQRRGVHHGKASRARPSALHGIVAEPEALNIATNIDRLSENTADSPWPGKGMAT